MSAPHKTRAGTAGQSRSWRRWLAMVTVLLLLAAGGWWWWRPPPVTPPTARVTRADIQLLITATGTVEPRRYVDVGAQVSGQVKRIHVQVGDDVKRGQLLMEIDPDVQQAVVEGARASLASLQAQEVEQRIQMRLASQQLKRRRRLLKQDAATREDLENAEAALEMAQARIASLQAKMQETRATLRAEETRLSYTRIYAPMDGTVIALEAREGQTLNATYQTPRMMRIADLATMTVRTRVSEADVQGVTAGMPVWFSPLVAQLGHEEAPRRWHGKVRQVLPAPDLPAGSSQGDGSQDSSASATTPTVVNSAVRAFRAVGGTPWPAALARRISARMPSQSWASVSVPSASSWLMPVRTGVGSLPSAMGHLLISEPHQQQAQPVQRQGRVELVLGEPRHAGQFGPCA